MKYVVRYQSAFVINAVCGQLEQVTTHRIPEVVLADLRIVSQRIEQRQRRAGAVDHAHGNGAADRGHRVRSHSVQGLVQRQNLRPVGSTAVAASSCTAAIVA
jgi:hypothetical protein